jgi:serine/threonine protein kinase
MTWPSPQDYSEAVQNPRTAFYESDLQRGTAEVDKLGLPRPRSGSFAIVYKILAGTRNWAVKCFLHPVLDQQERYAAISTHLAKTRLPYLIQFSYLAQGIRAAKQTYPILKMEWVEGESLIRYIERNLANARVLLALAGRWFEMMKALRRSSIAHGDLQHGNVLVANGELKLVDYDGMFVPSLAGKSSHELGQRNYQHPMRTEFDYGINLDNFSSWVIYISLIAIGLQPSLWGQFRGGDDCLLFRKEDFENPEQSSIFQTLEYIRDDKLRSATALFRSLLDLAPQDVPSLDGQILPSLTIPPTISSGGTWISDYVKYPSKTNVGSKIENLEPDPTPSWIQDFIAPPISATQQNKFENSIVQERIALLISVFAIAFIVICVYLKLIALATLVWGPVAILACNYAFWCYRFRLEPGVTALKDVNLELRSTADKIDLARAIIKSRQADKKSLQERYSFDQNKVSRDLEAARSDEKRETEGIQTSFTLGKGSISARRKAINQQETSDLQNISNTLGSQFANLNNRIASQVQAEAAELDAELAKQQNQSVLSYLRNYHIDSARLPGIGPGFKSRLRMAGILSAADVDHRIYGVKGMGSVRTRALTYWHQGLKARAQQKMPKALSLAETDLIKGRYSGQRQMLQSERALVDQRMRDAEASVRAKHKSIRETLEREDLAETVNAQSKIDIVRNKYKERFESFEHVGRKLGEDFKRGAAEIDERSNRERRNLFALHWEEEKIRRRRTILSTMVFSGYVKRVFGLA